VASRFRDGTIGEAPVLPGAGLFMPPGSAAWKDKGMFRLNAPEFLADRCTGCMECAIVCPDAAIPNTVHEIHDLLLTAIRHLDVTEAQKETLRGQVFSLAAAVREVYRQGREATSFAQTVAEALVGLPHDDITLRRNLGRVVEVLESFPVARTRPFFDAMEKAQPGTGGLFSAGVDPWKCSGCMECVDVCGPGALVQRTQDGDVLEMLQARFEFLSRTPNTPARFSDGATRPDGETKRLLLDRANYYSTTGGHGACRGCGEVTAIRLVVATNRAIYDRRRREHVRELDALIARLAAKRDRLASDERDAGRAQRIEATLRTLEKRLYLFESGPSGNGPASTVIANSTGCSSVFASTFPFNPYNDPWVNSLFQDAQPLAKGIFEGLVASALDDVRALRTARLELEDGYDPSVHDAFFRNFSWAQFEPEELALMPTVMTIGGDGATYDIGFGALSRLLVTDTPVKVVVLNSGVYSNTGGQASTASYGGQDSDLARFGSAQSGKQEDRKELGLIAAFHPNVFVVQTSTALQGHFLKSVMAFLSYNESPAVLDVYTPCQAEHGIADAAASRHARLAVESRMSPVFVHDPRRGESLRQWFSLEGNPEPTRDWAGTALEYIDADGRTKLLEVPLTPADFARQETRFAKQFRPLGADANAVPVHEYIDLSAADRAGRMPFVWSTDEEKRLVKLAVSSTIVELVEERRKYWRTLQYLSGQQIEALDASHRAELAHWQHQYQESVKQRETSLDSIARAMSELAASSGAPASNGLAATFMPAASAAPALAPPGANGHAAPLVTMDEADQAKCTNCKTCYQDLGEVFEQTRIMVDGVAKEVARMRPGALDYLKVTPELRSRAARVAANCDAEIIR
jgi:pyruvate-ferredoxin/flavodoxin oxidoreductase